MTRDAGPGFLRIFAVVITKTHIMKTHEIFETNDDLKRVHGQLFSVAKVPLYAPPLEVFRSTLGDSDATALGKPHQYGIYKTSGGEILGTAGENFIPQQPEDLLTAFASCLEDVQVDLSKLTYKERRGGARIEFSVPIPGIEFTNRAGVGDIVNLFLTLSAGYDGSAVKYRLDAERVICTNMWTAIRSELMASIRSTKNAKERIAFTCDEIAQTIAGSTQAKELVIAMNRADLSGRATREFVNQVFGIDTAAQEELHVVTQRRVDAIMESMELEMSRTGYTLWGALNGVTHYTNHISDTKWDRGDYVMVGTGAKYNNRAQRLILEMLS